jgi:hypothetical protein
MTRYRAGRAFAEATNGCQTRIEGGAAAGKITALTHDDRGGKGAGPFTWGRICKVKSFYLMTNVALVEQLRNPRTRATFAFDPLRAFTLQIARCRGVARYPSAWISLLAVEHDFKALGQQRTPSLCSPRNLWSFL